MAKKLESYSEYLKRTSGSSSSENEQTKSGETFSEYNRRKNTEDYLKSGSFQSDYEAANKAIDMMRGGWQSADAMKSARSSIENAYNSAKESADYLSGVDPLRNYNAIKGYRDIATYYGDFLNDSKKMKLLEEEYGKYESAESFNRDMAVRKEYSDAKKKADAGDYAYFDEQIAELENELTSLQRRSVEERGGGPAPKDASRKVTEDRISETKKKLAQMKELRHNAYSVSKARGWKEAEKNADYDKFAYERPTVPTAQSLYDYDEHVNMELVGRDPSGENIYRDSTGKTYTESERDKFFSEKAQIGKDILGIYLNGESDPNYDEYVNNPNSTFSIVKNMGDGASWSLLEPSEIDVYYYYLNRGNTEAAYKFLDDMEYQLGLRQQEANEKMLDGASDLELILANAASVPLNVLSTPIAVIDDAVHMIQGKEVNPHSSLRTPMNLASSIREETAGRIYEDTGSEFVSNAYQAAMSGLDSVFGGAAMGSAYTLSMGMGAASRRAAELTAQGVSNDKIILGAIASGAIEWLTEKYSYDEITKRIAGDEGASFKRKLASAIFGSAVEGIEEVNSDVLNLIVDSALNGYESTNEKDVRELVLQGMSEEDARKYIAAKNGIDILWSFYGGAISGAGLYAGGGAIGLGNYAYAVNKYNNAVNSQIGQNVTSNEGLSALAKLAEETTGADKLKNLSEKDTSGYSERKMERFNREVGKATRSVLAEQAEKTDRAARTEVENYIKEQFRSLGVTENLDTLASGVIHSTYENSGKLTAAESRAIAKVDTESKKVMQTLLNNKELNRRAAESYAQEASKYSFARNLATTSKDSTEGEFKASAEGKTIYTVDGKGEDVSVKSIASIAGGTVLLEDGRTVKASDISYATDADALAYEVAMRYAESDEGANAIVNLLKGANVKDTQTVNNAMLAYQYGLMNERSMLSETYLDEKLKTEMFAIGRSDSARRASAKAANAQITARIGKGKVLHFEKNVRSSDKMNAQQKATVEVAKTLVKSSPLDITIFESFEENGKRYAIVDGKKIKTTANGWYAEGSNRIYIDINAGNDYSGLGLYTLSHEISHYIRNLNAAQWQTMADLVVETIDSQYNGNNLKFDDLWQNKLDKYKQFKKDKMADYVNRSDKELEDMAYEDVVCDALQSIMAEEETFVMWADKVKAKDQSLWQRIKSAIEKFLSALRSGFSGKTAEGYAGQAIQNASKEMHDKIRELYVAAFVGANENFEKAEKGSSDNSGIVHSLRENENITARSMKYRSEHMSQSANVSDDMLKAANEMISDMVSYMKPYLDITNNNGKRYLPEEILGKTTFSNGSYGRTIENTTICFRTLAYIDFTNEIKKKIGRPLTVEESFLASQMLYDIAKEPQCLYCYVSLDRKAYDGFLIEYIKQRDAVLKKFSELKVKSKENIDAIYKEFLDGRKDTKPMKQRFNLWINSATKGEGLIRLEDLTTDEVRSEIKANGGLLAEQMFDAERYAQSASWAKKNEQYRAYNSDILKMSETMVKNLNKHYGLRFYSFSEYTPAFIVENMQQIRDASLKGLLGLAYTKKTDFARIFAGTGMNINISVFGKMVDGKVVEDSRQGASWEEVKELRKQHKNVGAVFVATSDELTEWALAQDWIDVVIPFHIVRTGANIAEFYKWTNNTKFQADTDSGGKNKTLTPAEHHNDLAAFKKLIAERGLTPRFAQFIDNPNYMKLVNETRLSDLESDKLHPTFDLEAAKKSFDAFVNDGGYYGDWYNEGIDYKAAVDTVAEDVLSGKRANEVEYGRQDINVSEEMKNRWKNREHGRLNSLRDVDPVKPSSKAWSRGATTAEAMRIYPDLWNVSAEESETRNPTQITSTVGTYRKIYEILKKQGFKGTILDASSGLGYGTRAGIDEYGFDVEDIEPYPAKDYSPKYTDYSKLNKKYDVIISNAVLNVLPQDQRDALVVKMGEMLNDGGRIFINVRSLSEIQSLQTKLDSKTGKPKNIKISNSEVAETSKGSYQKGFTKNELKAYLEDALGEGYEVKPTTLFGGTSVIVTKSENYSTENTSERRLYAERDFPIDKEVADVVRNAASGNKATVNELSTITPQQNSAINRLASSTGNDKYRGKFTGGKHTFRDTMVRHALSEHGDFLREGLRGQLPITENDIARTLSAIKDNKNPSGIKATKTKRGDPSIVTSFMINGYTIYAEELVDQGWNGSAKSLNGNTMYKAPTLTTAAVSATSAATLPKRKSLVLQGQYITSNGNLSTANFVADEKNGFAKLKYAVKDGTPIADRYAGGLIVLSSDENNLTEKGEGIEEGYVLCKKPFIITAQNTVFTNSDDDVAEKISELKKKGYDCFIFDYKPGDNYMVAVVRKEQIVPESRMYSERFESTLPADAEAITKKHFGTTKNWAETGFLLADGTQLDFSGRHWRSDPDIDLPDSYFDGQRNAEHYEIADAFEGWYPSKMDYRGEILYDFINRGNIRIVNMSGTVELPNTEPTEAQYEKLKEYFNRIDKSRYITVSTNDDRITLTIPADTSSSKIIEEIRRAYENNIGSRSDLMQFHTDYSDEARRFSDRILFGSVFSGAGTVEQGLVYQMVDKEFAVEWKPEIASVYMDNNGKDHMWVGDIRKFDSSKKNHVFYLHASPVCTRYSMANHKRGAIELDMMTAKATARILEEQMPEVFTVENVKQYKGSPELQVILDKLHDLGYKYDVGVYSASDYGNPTKRERLIVRAVKNGELPALPVPVSTKTSWGEATKDLWSEKGLEPWHLSPQVLDAIKNTPALKGIDLKHLDQPLMIYGTNKSHQVDFAWADGLAPTLTTKCGDARIIMTDGKVYKPTPAFMGRLQGLPDNFKYPEQKTLAFRVIGNGVPTQLTSAVMGGLLESAYETEYGSKLYSERDNTPSNRELLANAMTPLAANQAEANKLTEYTDNIVSLNEQEDRLKALKAELKELSFSKGKRDTKRISELKGEITKTENRINIYDKRLLNLEAAKPLKDVLERENRQTLQREREQYMERQKQRIADLRKMYQESHAKSIQDMRDRYAASRARAVERRNTTEMRNKVIGIVKTLNEYLLTNSDKKHVPLGLQGVVAEALDVFNFDTVSAEKKFNGYTDENGVFHKGLNQLIAEAKDEETRESLKERAARIQTREYRVAEKLGRLKAEYDKIQKDPDTANLYYEEISERIGDLAEWIGDTPIADMSYAQLEELYDTYKMLLHTIREENKAFKEGIKQSIAELSDSVISEVRTVGGTKEKTASALKGIREFAWNDLKPIYAFRAIGSDTLTGLFKNILKGQDGWYLDMAEAKQFRDGNVKKYGFSKWDFDTQYEFTSRSGKKFKMSLGQMLSIYAYSKRDQARDHLNKGGIVFDSAIEVVEKNKWGVPIKYNLNTKESFGLTDETISEITSKLTAEQKSFVDEMQKYLSDVMGKKGNDVSLKLFGVKLFKEENYFPIVSSDMFLTQKNEPNGMRAIRSPGLSKALVRKANNPMVISDFMTVWAKHVNDMSMYHSFVLPIEDLNRVYNYRTAITDEAEPTSVKQTISNAYGDEPLKYIKTLITDLNGGARFAPGAGTINALVGAFKKASTMASLSVVIQQPASIARAMAYIPPKYFSGAFVLNKDEHNSEWAELKKYAPVAGIKEMGYFDTDMGRASDEWLNSDEVEGGFREKVAEFFKKDSKNRDDILSKAPALADEFAWVAMWKATKNYIAATTSLKPGTEEYLKACGDKFEEVIELTQVYDSILTRSGMMRSKDVGMRMVTSFMAEPTVSANMAIDAVIEAKRTGNKRLYAERFGAIAGSAVLTALLRSIIMAWRDSDKKKYGEAYAERFLSDLLENLNPLNLFPVARDIVSIAQGWKVERPDMTVFTDLATAIRAFDSDSKSLYTKITGLMGAIGNMVGVPIRNIERDLRPLIAKIIKLLKGEE